MTEQFKVGDKVKVNGIITTIEKNNYGGKLFGVTFQTSEKTDGCFVEYFSMDGKRFDTNKKPHLLPRKFKKRVDKVDVEAEAQKAWKRTEYARNGVVMPTWWVEGFRACAASLMAPKKTARVWTLEQVRAIYSKTLMKNGRVEWVNFKEELLAQKPTDTPKPEPVKPERKLIRKAWIQDYDDLIYRYDPAYTPVGDQWQRVPSLDVYEEGEK